MSGLKERAAEELKAFVYIALYFWAFSLAFELTQTATLRSAGVTAVHHGFAIVTALVLAKVALVLESLYKKRQVRNTRLVYQVLSHAVVLTLTLIVFGAVEEGVKLLLHGGHLGEQLTWQTESFLLAKAAVFFVALIPFCAFQELARVVGTRELTELFFGARTDG